MTENVTSSESIGDPIQGILDALTLTRGAIASGTLTPERLIDFVNRESGKKKGRKVPELPEFTFPDSGYTVRVRKIGPWTLNQIRSALRKARREPQVPVIDVEDGEYPDGRIRYRKEANSADPDYKQAVLMYEDWLNENLGVRLLDIICSTCIIPDSEDIDHQEVIHQRRSLLMTSDPSDEGYDQYVKWIDSLTDEEVFVRCSCLSSMGDLAAIRDFVMSNSMPTDRGVSEQIDTFRPEV